MPVLAKFAFISSPRWAEIFSEHESLCPVFTAVLPAATPYSSPSSISCHRILLSSNKKVKDSTKYYTIYKIFSQTRAERG